jgi:hypothetical protein
MTDKLPFSSKEYDKLDRAVFPTIRRRDKYGDVGDVNTVIAGEKGDREVLGDAEIIAKEKVTLKELMGPFIWFDTQSYSDAAARTSINRFYQTPIEMEEELTLYWNKWV